MGGWVGEWMGGWVGEWPHLIFVQNDTRGMVRTWLLPLALLAPAACYDESAALDKERTSPAEVVARRSFSVWKERIGCGRPFLFSSFFVLYFYLFFLFCGGGTITFTF